MSDITKLKEAISEYRKINKTLDESLTKIEQEKRKSRQEQTDSQNR